MTSLHYQTALSNDDQPRLADLPELDIWTNRCPDPSGALGMEIVWLPRFLMLADAFQIIEFEGLVNWFALGEDLTRVFCDSLVKSGWLEVVAGKDEYKIVHASFFQGAGYAVN